MFSCRKNIGNANWDISLLTPLINTSMGVNNLLADSILQVNPDTSLKIVYNSTLYNFGVDSLVNFPDTISNHVFYPPFSYTVHPGWVLMNDTANNYLSPGHSGQLRKIIVKSGFVILTTKNPLSQKILCKYQIPCATKNGIPFDTTFLVPAAGINGPTLFQRKVNISGYTILLTGPNGNVCNTLTSITQAWLDPQGDTVTVTNSDSLRLLTTFQNLVINYAQGYFGNQSSVTGLQRSYFSLFKNITGGSLSLEEMHLLLTIRNGYGVDASFVSQPAKIGEHL